MIKRHHTLYTRTSWESHEQTKFLREQPSLIVPMDSEYEQALHEAVPTVPLLCPHIAYRTARDYVPSSSHIGSMYNLMEVIEKATFHHRVTDIQAKLADLAVEGIRLQLPFIREGEVRNGT